MKKLSDEDSGDILGGTEEARISQSLSLVIGDLHSPPPHPPPRPSPPHPTPPRVLLPHTPSAPGVNR